MLDIHDMLKKYHIFKRTLATMFDIGSNIHVRVEKMEIDYADGTIIIDMSLILHGRTGGPSFPVKVTFNHPNNTILIHITLRSGRVVQKTFHCDRTFNVLAKNWLQGVVESDKRALEKGCSTSNKLDVSGGLHLRAVDDSMSCSRGDDLIVFVSERPLVEIFDKVAESLCEGSARNVESRENSVMNDKEHTKVRGPSRLRGTSSRCGTKEKIETVCRWSRHNLRVSYDVPPTSARHHATPDALKSASSFTIYSLQRHVQHHVGEETETNQDNDDNPTILTPTPPLTKPLTETTMRNKRRHTRTNASTADRMVETDDTTNDISLLSSASDLTSDIRDVEGLKEINAKQNHIIAIQYEQIERMKEENENLNATIENLRREIKGKTENISRMKKERDEMREELTTRMEGEERAKELHRTEREMYRKLISGAKRKIEALTKRKDDILERFVEKLVASAEENDNLEEKNKELKIEVDREKRINDALLKLGRHQKQHQ